MCGRKTLHLQPHRRPSKPQHQTRQNGERQGRDRRSVRAMEFTPVLPVPIYPVPCVCVAAYNQRSHLNPKPKKWTQCDRRVRGLKKDLQRRLIALIGEPPEEKNQVTGYRRGTHSLAKLQKRTQSTNMTSLSTATCPASAAPPTASSRPTTTPPSSSPSARLTRTAATPARTRPTLFAASSVPAARAMTPSTA